MGKMRKFLIIIPIFLFVAACGKEKVSENSSQIPKKEEPKTETTKLQGSTSKDETKTGVVNTGGIRNLSYDVTESSIPDEAKHDGTVVAGASWDDNNGFNIVFVTETKIKDYSGGQEGLEYRKKELYGYHYISNGGETRLLWKINDFVKDCPLDLNLNLLQGSLSVTDINNNGIGESTFLYTMACRGDVSPTDMKLLMHEGETKYAIRGTRKLKLQGETYGGETNVDKSFSDAPSGFLDYAKEQWSKYRDQKLDEN